MINELQAAAALQLPTAVSYNEGKKFRKRYKILNEKKVQRFEQAVGSNPVHGDAIVRCVMAVRGCDTAGRLVACDTRETSSEFSHKQLLFTVNLSNRKSVEKEVGNGSFEK